MAHYQNLFYNTQPLITDGMSYREVVQALITQYGLNESEANVMMHDSYCRKFVIRDAQIFRWLKDERESWLLPLYHILIIPNNALRDLDFDDLKSIFENLAPPSNVDDLAAMFGGMSI